MDTVFTDVVFVTYLWMEIIFETFWVYHSFDNQTQIE